MQWDIAAYCRDVLLNVMGYTQRAMHNDLKFCVVNSKINYQ